jgi:hypothetical protein
MAKSKKRKKKVTPPCGGYKKFINDMMNYIHTNYEHEDRSFSPQEKRLIYDCRLQLRRPEAANLLVNVKEIDKIYKNIKKLHHKKKHAISDRKTLSTYEVLLFHSYMRAIEERYKKELGLGHVKYLGMKEAVGSAFKAFLGFYILDIFATVTRLSNPMYKYYGITTRLANLVNDDLRLEMTTSVSGIPAQKKRIKYDGHYRPAYRLGKAVENTGFEWITYQLENLPKSFSKKYSAYHLYIQAHAINRLKERLDLLDAESINYTIWEATVSKVEIIRHKQYTLLPVKVHHIRIGYFVIEPIEDMLIIKTFLFITHNCTPEGDKLKEITGLGKSDISYWKIDRLSTFINLDEEKYPKMMRLFTDAGMKDLTQLKDKEFDIESIQTSNFDKLRQYLENSRQYKNAKEEDVVIHV